MNEQQTVLTPLPSGLEFVEADVWVLFFQNESEINSMPPFIQHLYALDREKDEARIQIYGEFKLDTGSSKAVMFIILDGFKTGSEEVISCEAATDLYFAVLGNTDFAEREIFKNSCEKLM
mgnify:CR=1 FL=1